MIDSDEAGRFMLDLAPGWHWLRIEMAGFHTRRIALSVPREQREVGLAPITLEIGEITMGVFIETAPPGRGKRRGRPRP